MSPGARFLNSPFISPNIYLGMSPHIGLDFSACMTHIRAINTHAQPPHTTQRHQCG
uniref:Uncharacterized protein n=1 Tax=Mesocestoides corti TaxID=53468 RepID=A0A5K3FEW9_MESCO